MKPAAWLALLLLIGSFVSCMWLVAGVATNVLVPGAMPETGRLTVGETLVGGAICGLLPLTLVIASGMVWWFGVHKQSARHAARPTMPPAPLPAPVLATQPAHPASAAPAPAPPHVLLEAYLEKMTELLFRHNWRDGALNSDIQGIIQAETRRTLAVLVPAERRRVLLFLQRTGLLRGDQPISMYRFDLCGTDLRFIDLRNASLAGINLRRARLTGADLRGCDLSDADLSEADLRMAWIDAAKLDRANLQQTRLQRASLRGTSLLGANLRDAYLWEADMRDARVTGIQLRAAKLPPGFTMAQTDQR